MESRELISVVETICTLMGQHQLSVLDTDLQVCHLQLLTSGLACFM